MYGYACININIHIINNGNSAVKDIGDIQVIKVSAVLTEQKNQKRKPCMNRQC